MSTCIEVSLVAKRRYALLLQSATGESSRRCLSGNWCWHWTGRASWAFWWMDVHLADWKSWVAVVTNDSCRCTTGWHINSHCLWAIGLEALTSGPTTSAALSIVLLHTHITLAVGASFLYHSLLTSSICYSIFGYYYIFFTTSNLNGTV